MAETKKKNKTIDDKRNTIKGKKKESDNTIKKINILIIFIIIAILFIILIVFGITSFISNKNANHNIKSVKKVLKTEYSYIDCIDSNCNGFVAIKGDKLKKTTIELINIDGKKVASYNEVYDSNSKNLKTPYQLTDKYFIMKTINSENPKNIKYSIMNTKGKETYVTSNELRVINEKFVLMMDKKNNTYSILDINGREKYNNISDINTYLNGKYISLEIYGNNIILNEKGKKVLDNYKVDRVVKDDLDNDKVLYFVVKNVKNSVYNYYDVNKSKIKGDVFSSYTSSENNGELIITKKANNRDEKYILRKNGEQIRMNDNIGTSEIVSEIKEKIDTEIYNLYDVSIIKKGQKNILVDNKNDRSIGILNLDTNKYTEIYKYDLEGPYFYSSVDKLSSNDSDLYLKISCSKPNCVNSKTIIYDFEHLSEIYRKANDDLIISDYVHYENDYKVIKYSSSSSNDKYKEKYVLYNKDNKEVYKSSNKIAIIDKKISFGNEYKSPLSLYSAKESKILVSDNEPVSVITIKDKKLYKYTDKNNNIVICNLKGEKVITAKSDYLKYTNTSIIYLEDEKIVIYDVTKAKSKIYKLKKNEKINDVSGDIIPPYRGSVFVNNSTDKYVKVINYKGEVLKKINKVEISTVEPNQKNKNIFIIVKGNGKTGNVYGLYVAK